MACFYLQGCGRVEGGGVRWEVGVRGGVTGCEEGGGVRWMGEGVQGGIMQLWKEKFVLRMTLPSPLVAPSCPPILGHPPTPSFLLPCLRVVVGICIFGYTLLGYMFLGK